MSPAPPELPPPTVIHDRRGFDSLLHELRGASIVALDTEADSFFNYREKVCLIQLSALGRDWLVDPLAGFDLSALGELLADPARTKVFHDGEYDILILKRDFGFDFKNLYDTRIAASALGNKSPGLAAVLLQHFGVELDKSLQRSDWSQRPLSPQQVAYARLDTHFLERLREVQEPLLATRARARIVREEITRLERLEPPQRVFDPEEYARLKGARNLEPLSMRALRELYVWREREAEKRDLPPFKVLSNEQLVALAQLMPATPRQLTQPGCLYPRQAHSVGTAVLAAVAEARRLGPLQRRAGPATSAAERERQEQEAELLERLKQWRKLEAEKLDVDSALVLNRWPLERIGAGRPREPAHLAAIEGLLPWQLETYGQSLLSIVQQFEHDLAAGQIDFSRRRRGRP